MTLQAFDERSLSRTLRLKLAATRAGLVAESITTAFWPALTLLLAALAAALLDLPALLPGWLHLGLLLAVAAAFLWFLWRGVRRFAWPSKDAALARLETSSGLPHRPLSASLDTLPPERTDPVARAVFAIHRERARAQLGRLRPPAPRPVLPAADALGATAVAALLLVVGVAAAGPEWRDRLAGALAPRLAATAAPLPATLDAWLDPPDYTGLPPVYLAAGEAPAPLRVPTGSELVVQVQGGDGVPELKLDETATPFTEAAGGVYKVTLEIAEGSRLEVLQDGEPLAVWPLSVLPDEPPTALFASPPAASERQALAIAYEAHDDYGLADVKVEIRRADQPDAPPLTLDLSGVGSGRKVAKGETYRDLTQHPWAGLAVEAVLIATDELGQEGRSTVERLLLPERIFSHPVARALIEMRRQLTLKPEERRRIAAALEAIGDQPQAYGHDVVVALGIVSAAARLVRDRDARAIPQVQELLWDLAIRLEEGDLSLFARDLRELQQRLMEALENGASDEEIEALIDQLEQAMQQYLQALAQEMQRRMAEGLEPQPLPPDAQVIEGRDLQRMIEELRQLSQAGAKERAQELLQQLQNMMENLSANPMAMMPSDQMQQALEQMQRMEDMLRRQQDLLDQSYREAEQGQGNQSRQQGEQRSGPQMQGQADSQEQLRRELGELMRDLAQQMGDLPGELGRAEQAMRGARDALRGNDAEGAIPQQTEAIDQLQQGLGDLTEQLVQQMGQQPGRGQGRTGVRPGQSLDPLDRRSGDGSLDAVDRIEIPEAGDLSRAREILEELRRRRNDPARPQIEQDYIDRLLNQF